MTYEDELLYKFAPKTGCQGMPITARRFSAPRLYFFATIAAGCILRFLALLNNPAIEMDGIQYAAIAEAFSAGRLGEALGNVFPPGYPLLIALIHSVVPDLELAGRLVSLIFGTLLIWLSFSLGRRIMKDDTKALWLSFMVAFHPYLVRYSGEALSESLATFLFTLTLFSFYIAWDKKSRLFAALSGFCLVLAYLTRPEYLIFFVPLVLMLLWRRRVVESLALFLPLFVIGSLYVLYLHSRTGLWIVSNKATLLPVVSLSGFIANIPVVSLCFIMAISPLFFALAIIGIRRLAILDIPYRNSLLLLVVFHIVSLSFIGHATKRYSVEFIPLCLISAVEGIHLLLPYLAGRFNRQTAQRIAILVIMAVSLFQAYDPIHQGRALNKKAGLFLLSYDPGAVIASRLPIAAFYAKGSAVDILSEIGMERSIAHFNGIVARNRVKYLIIDEKVEGELSFLNSYLTEERMVWSAGDRNTFIRIYRLH